MALILTLLVWIIGSGNSALLFFGTTIGTCAILTLLGLFLTPENFLPKNSYNQTVEMRNILNGHACFMDYFNTFLGAMGATIFTLPPIDWMLGMIIMAIICICL